MKLLNTLTVMALGAVLFASPSSAASRVAQDSCQKGVTSLKGKTSADVKPGKAKAFEEDMATAQKALAKSDYNTCNKHLSQARRNLQ